MSKEAIKLQPREPFTPELVNVLHSPKRVRVKFGGETIADSRETLILRSNQFLPIYFFPQSAIADGVLTAEHAAATRSWAAGHETGACRPAAGPRRTPPGRSPASTGRNSIR